jgi:hypothetical protein
MKTMRNNIDKENNRILVVKRNKIFSKFRWRLFKIYLEKRNKIMTMNFLMV